MMPPWVSSLLFSVLVSTVPMSWVLRMFMNLPAPLAVSHTRWPTWVNVLIIGFVTTVVTFFVNDVYYGSLIEPSVVGAKFLMTSLLYGFAFTLLLRQFKGLYPEYLITVGRTGLSITKTVYRNITKVEVVKKSRGELTVVVELQNGDSRSIELPKEYLSVFHDRIKTCRKLN